MHSLHSIIMLAPSVFSQCFFGLYYAFGKFFVFLLVTSAIFFLLSSDNLIDFIFLSPFQISENTLSRSLIHPSPRKQCWTMELCNGSLTTMSVKKSLKNLCNPTCCWIDVNLHKLIFQKKNIMHFHKSLNVFFVCVACFQFLWILVFILFEHFCVSSISPIYNLRSSFVFTLIYLSFLLVVVGSDLP